MWKCKCGAMVSDKTEECPLCNRGPSGTIIIAPDCGEGTETPQVLDEEGYTQEDRMKKRSFREIANNSLLLMQRARRRAKNRKVRPFADAVVPGSVRTSRPIFSTIKR